MSPYKVCHISTVHSLFDDRIFFKECRSLAKCGYEVSLMVQHNKNEIIDGVRIYALPSYPSRLKRLFNGTFKAFKLARKTKADLFHFHDPELMFLGVLLRVSGKKVIYDVHEDLPKQILYKDWINSKFIKKIFSKLIYLSEQFSCLFFNGIVAATEDIAKKFPRKKTIVLRNFPLLSLIENEAPHDIQNKDTFVLVYAGGLSRIRGIKEIIEALGLVKGKVSLWLFGEFEHEGYFEECKKLEAWNNVEYFGYKKMDEVYGFIQQADVGIALLYPIKNYLTSLPVKAFEYMAAGKAFIMSDFPFWKEMFGECALFADPFNPDEIAEKVRELVENKELTKKLGARGKELIETKYSWEMEKKGLFELYKRILD